MLTKLVGTSTQLNPIHFRPNPIQPTGVPNLRPCLVQSSTPEKRTRNNNTHRHQHHEHLVINKAPALQRKRAILEKIYCTQRKTNVDVGLCVLSDISTAK